MATDRPSSELFNCCTVSFTAKTAKRATSLNSENVFSLKVSPLWGDSLRLEGF